MAAARGGDLGRRVDLSDKQGFFRQLGAGINELVGIVDQVFKDIASVMRRMAEGDLTRPISRDYDGAFGAIKEDVNKTLANIDCTLSRLRVAIDDVTTGATLYNSISSTGMFPLMLLQMVSIGEESGALDEMLDKVASYYEDAVDNAVDSLSSLMEPLIMSVLGVLVGGLMIAMYLPIFMLGSVI